MNALIKAEIKNVKDYLLHGDMNRIYEELSLSMSIERSEVYSIMSCRWLRDKVKVKAVLTKARSIAEENKKVVGV